MFGKGWGYGAEFLIRKKYGKLTGWISYTLSKTKRQFPDINDGNVFLAKQDRPHNLAIVGMYDINSETNFFSHLDLFKRKCCYLSRRAAISLTET